MVIFQADCWDINYFYINVLLRLLKELLKLNNLEQTTYSIRFVLLSNINVTTETNFINYQNWPFAQQIISKQQIIAIFSFYTNLTFDQILRLRRISRLSIHPYGCSLVLLFWDI